MAVTRQAAEILWVGKDACSLGDDGYFSANWTKVEFPPTLLTVSANSIEFNSDGTLDLDNLDSW